MSILVSLNTKAEGQPFGKMFRIVEMGRKVWVAKLLARFRLGTELQPEGPRHHPTILPTLIHLRMFCKARRSTSGAFARPRMAEELWQGPV